MSKAQVRLIFLAVRGALSNADYEPGFREALARIDDLQRQGVRVDGAWLAGLDANGWLDLFPERRLCAVVRGLLGPFIANTNDVRAGCPLVLRVSREDVMRAVTRVQVAALIEQMAAARVV